MITLSTTTSTSTSTTTSTTTSTSLGRTADRDVVVTIDPRSGGRIAQIEVWGRPILVAPGGPPTMWGSFPMTPWAGRLAHGRFEIDGETFQVPLDLPPHAIHGTTYDAEWTVDGVVGEPAAAQAVEMSCPLAWPLGGTARQRLEIDERSLVCELTVTAGDRRMPAEVGWHPWFAKPERLEFTPEAMYVRRDALPTGELVSPVAGPWDDCFINTDPVSLHHDDLVVTVSSDCDHWVVYDEPTHATCVEPQSGPPDAFNLRPRILEPGERFGRTMTVSWRRPSPTVR